MAYLFPTILSSVAILLSAFVDGIFASAFCGNDAFAAVNLSEPAVLFMQAVFFLFGIGGAVRISVAKGRREHEKANTLFSLAVVFGVISSVVVGILGVLFIDPIVSVMCNNAELTQMVKDYTLVTFLGAPLMIFVPMMTYIIRTDGMPKLSANILLFANLLNLCMDVVYMKFLNMGTRGAALATVTGYALGLGLVIVYFRSRKRTLKFHIPKGEEWKETGNLCTGGIASVFNTILLFVKSILLNRIVLATGGAAAMAVFSVCNFTVTFASMFIGGGSDTMTPLLGMLYGERDQKGMDYVFRRTMLVVLVSCLAMVAVMLIVPQAVLGLFDITSASKLAMGIPAIRIFSFSLLGVGILYTLMNYYQTISHKGMSVLITVLRGLAVTVPSAYFFSSVLGVTGIWISIPVAEFLTLLIIVAVSLITAAKSGGKFKGVLLKETVPEGEAVFDLTLAAGKEEAGNVAEMAEAFCLENGATEKQASFAGVLSEEMIENVRLYNEKEEKRPQIDLVLRIMPEEMLILVRDDGKTLSSAEPEEGSEEFSNLKMIHSIAKKVDYSRTLGLNSTVVTLAREHA